MINIGCYQPLIRSEHLTEWATAKDGHKYHPARIFSTKQLESYDNLKNSYSNEWGNWTPIPCGQCIGCRLDNSREWANRGYLEGKYYENKNWFVTLTYNDDNLTIPETIETKNGFIFTKYDGIEWKGTLVPEELKQFMKNLRQIMKREFNVDGIRFIGCGEYGSEKKTNRPHYHLIIFNCPLPAESFYDPEVNWEKNIYYKNDIIERAWGKDKTKHKEAKGICNISEATWNNIAYTARYVTKKINGEYAPENYGAKGQIKEFFRCSNRPGIARQYYEDNKKEIYRTDKILIHNKKGAHWVTPPEYFDKLYEKEDPEHMKWIKERRKKRQLDTLIIKGQNTSLTRWEQYQVEKRTKENAAIILKRPLD